MTWITASFPHLHNAVKARVVAGTTTRQGGISSPPYDGLNIAAHVADDGKSVAANRAILREQIALPNEPYWLTQTHSDTAIELPYQYRSDPSANKDSITEADAAYTKLTNCVCTVMTADCLPLLIVDSNGTKVAAIHAGWRGLAAGIVTKTIAAMAIPAADLHVWLGPAIGPEKFEVGPEVRAAFVDKAPGNSAGFVSHKEGKFLCNLYFLAKLELQMAGVNYISGGEHCTFSEEQAFYSYRRDGQTGRMASMIWLKEK